MHTSPCAIFYHPTYCHIWTLFMSTSYIRHICYSTEWLVSNRTSGLHGWLVDAGLSTTRGAGYLPEQQKGDKESVTAVCPEGLCICLHRCLAMSLTIVGYDILNSESEFYWNNWWIDLKVGKSPREGIGVFCLLVCLFLARATLWRLWVVSGVMGIMILPKWLLLADEEWHGREELPDDACVEWAAALGLSFVYNKPHLGLIPLLINVFEFFFCHQDASKRTNYSDFCLMVLI